MCVCVCVHMCVCVGVCLWVQSCEDLILMHLGFLDFSYYFVTIRFYDLEEAKFNVRSITFDVSLQ